MKLSPALYAPFPGGRQLGQDEAARAADILLAQSPYRYYGISSRRECDQLERSLARILNVTFCQVVSSGSAALHAALSAIGVTAGDEVILPAYGWVSDLMAVISCGAVPVICPVDRSLGLCAQTIHKAISPRTKAIIAIHMRGFPCDIEAIKLAAGSVPIVEDCAQSLGAFVNGRSVGSFGAMGAFSFQFNKLITGGEGGAVATSNPAIFNYVRAFQDLGLDREAGHGDPVGVGSLKMRGFNYRMSEVTAGILNVQLSKIDVILNKLKENFELGTEELTAAFPRLHPCIVKNGHSPNRAFIVLIGDNIADVKSSISFLNEQGIKAQSCGVKDPHHFRVWESFLREQGIEYKVFEAERAEDTLDCSLYVEVSST